MSAIGHCLDFELALDVRVVSTLGKGSDDADIVDVRIEARIEGVDVQRRTRFFRAGEEMTTSKWATIRRAR